MELIDLKMKMEKNEIEGKISGSGKNKSYGGELSGQPRSNEVVSQKVT